MEFEREVEAEVGDYTKEREREQRRDPLLERERERQSLRRIEKRERSVLLPLFPLSLFHFPSSPRRSTSQTRFTLSLSSPSLSSSPFERRESELLVIRVPSPSRERGFSPGPSSSGKDGEKEISAIAVFFSPIDPKKALVLFLPRRRVALRSRFFPLFAASSHRAASRAAAVRGACLPAEGKKQRKRAR